MVILGKKKMNENPLTFKRGFFRSISRLKLTPCEYKCLIMLFEGGEYTKSQVANELNIARQHIGLAMKHLESIGLIVCSKTEGRNEFFVLNLKFIYSSDEDKNQLTFL